VQELVVEPAMLRNLKGKLKLMAAAPLRPRQQVLRQVEYAGARFLVLANEDVGWRLIVHGHYEPLEWRCLQEFISPTDVCVDVGANIGLYTILLARKAHLGRVIAFEPLPLYRAMLDLNACLNGTGNIEIQASVVADSTGQQEFSVSVDGAYSSIRPTARKPEARRIMVPSVTLDDAFAVTRQRIDIMKVDVEGAELLVLRGARTLLSDPELRPRALLLELEASNEAAYSYQPDDVVAFMAQLNYGVHSLGRSGVLRGYRPERLVETVLFLAE